MSTGREDIFEAVRFAQVVQHEHDHAHLGDKLLGLNLHDGNALVRSADQATIADLSERVLASDARVQELERRLENDDHRLERAAQKALEEAAKKGVFAAGKPIKSVTPEEAIESLLSNIRGDGSKATGYQKSVQRRLTVFVERTRKRRTVAHISEITLDDINRHLDYLRAPKVRDEKTGESIGEGLDPKTIKDNFGAIRQLLRHAEDQGWIERDPTGRKKSPKVPKGEIRFYLASEVEAIFREAEGDPFLSAAFAVVLYTGLRLDEAFKIRWDQVHIEKRKFHFRAGKTDKERDVPIFDQLEPFLKALPREGKTLFGEGRKKQALGRSVLRLVKRALPDRAAEAEADGAKGDGSQTARRTLATHLRAMGVSAKRIAEWLGHNVDVLEENYCGLLPDGERPLKLTFLGEPLTTDGLPFRNLAPGTSGAPH